MTLWKPVLLIRIRRIHMFLGLPDPASEIRLRILLSWSKNSKKNINSYFFATSLAFFLWKMMYINVPSKSSKQKYLEEKKILLKVSDPHPYQNFMDPQHCDTMRAFSALQKDSPGSSLHAINSATLLAAAGFILTPALKIQARLFHSKNFSPEDRRSPSRWWFLQHQIFSKPGSNPNPLRTAKVIKATIQINKQHLY